MTKIYIYIYMRCLLQDCVYKLKSWKNALNVLDLSVSIIKNMVYDNSSFEKSACNGFCSYTLKIGKTILCIIYGHTSL